MQKGFYEIKAVNESEYIKLLWDDWDEEKASAMASRFFEIFIQLYEAVANGALDAVRYFSPEKKNYPRTVYMLHRSTRQGVLLQLSIATVNTSGELFPLSHRDINDCGAFLSELSIFSDTYVEWVKL